MKNLETYLAPHADIVYYFSGKPLCALDASDPDGLPDDDGIELPDIPLG